MKNKSWPILLILLLLLTGCSGGSSYSAMNPREIRVPSGMAMSYSKMNGKKLSDLIVVPPGKSWEVEVEVVTESGTLAVCMADDKDRDVAIYRADNVQTSQFTIPLPGPGAYVVWVEGENHKGSFWIMSHPAE